MRRVIVLSICGLALSACTSGSFLKFETKPTPATLRLESVPPGAEAKLATGEACKTPCGLPVTGDMKELTVTYTLEGYKPEAVEVAVAPPLSASEPIHLDPNPVTVELEKAPVVKKRRVVVRKPVAGRPETAVRKRETVVRKPETVVRKPAATVTKKKTVTVVKKPARKPVVRKPKVQPKPTAAPAAQPAPARAAPAPAPSGSAPSPWGPPPQIPGSAPTAPPPH